MRHTQCWPLLSDILIFLAICMSHFGIYLPLFHLLLLSCSHNLSVLSSGFGVSHPQLSLSVDCGVICTCPWRNWQGQAFGPWVMIEWVVHAVIGARLYRDLLYYALQVWWVFVPAVARLFCLALPGSFLTLFVKNKGDLCINLFLIDIRRKISIS